LKKILKFKVHFRFALYNDLRTNEKRMRSKGVIGMSYQDIFKRYEMKYMLTKEQKEIVLRAMEQYMKPDEYGRSTICNIYFDTPDYQLIRHSLEKPVYKEKLRVRSYGPAAEDGTVFVELKKKYKGVVYKRRISAKQKEAMDYLVNGEKLPEQITFDQNILWRKEDLSLSSKVYGTPILEPGCSLMEIKIASAMPMWLGRVLSENGIFKTSFSKYGRAYEMIREEEIAGDSVVNRIYADQKSVSGISQKTKTGESSRGFGRKRTQIA